MVYTPIMLELFQKNKSKIYIGLGVLLIVGGLIGNIVTFIEADSSRITGAYRFVEKINAVTVRSVIERSDPLVFIEEQNIFEKNSIQSFSYLIRNSQNRQLEIPLLPDKIEIPSISLVAPVTIAEFNFTDLDGETFGQWIAPSEFAAAWHPNSALLGENGNIVINGHHNEFGKVFGKLVDLESGDFVYIYTKGKKYTFVISNKMILLEKDQPADVRRENAEWLGKTDDIRLTLITCWPEKSNTHRLILVARPY